MLGTELRDLLSQKFGALEERLQQADQNIWQVEQSHQQSMGQLQTVINSVASIQRDAFEQSAQVQDVQSLVLNLKVGATARSTPTATEASLALEETQLPVASQKLAGGMAFHAGSSATTPKTPQYRSGLYPPAADSSPANSESPVYASGLLPQGRGEVCEENISPIESSKTSQPTSPSKPASSPVIGVANCSRPSPEALDAFTKHMPYTSMRPGSANVAQQRRTSLSASAGATQSTAAGAMCVRPVPTSHVVTRTSSAPALVRRSTAASSMTSLPGGSRSPRFSQVSFAHAQVPLTVLPNSAPQTPRCVPLEEVADTMPMISGMSAASASRVSSVTQPLSARCTGPQLSARWSQHRLGQTGSPCATPVAYPPLLPPASPVAQSATGPCYMPQHTTSAASLRSATPMHTSSGPSLAQVAGLGRPASRSHTVPTADSCQAGVSRWGGVRSATPVANGLYSGGRSAAIPPGDALQSGLFAQQCSVPTGQRRSSSVPTGQRQEAFRFSPGVQLSMVPPAGDGNDWASPWMQPPQYPRPTLH